MGLKTDYYSSIFRTFRGSRGGSISARAKWPHRKVNSYHQRVNIAYGIVVRWHTGCPRYDLLLDLVGLPLPSFFSPSELRGRCLGTGGFVWGADRGRSPSTLERRAFEARLLRTTRRNAVITRAFTLEYPCGEGEKPIAEIRIVRRGEMTRSFEKTASSVALFRQTSNKGLFATSVFSVEMCCERLLKTLGKGNLDTAHFCTPPSLWGDLPGGLVNWRNAPPQEERSLRSRSFITIET